MRLIKNDPNDDTAPLSRRPGPGKRNLTRQNARKFFPSEREVNQVSVPECPSGKILSHWNHLCFKGGSLIRLGGRRCGRLTWINHPCFVLRAGIDFVSEALDPPI